MNIKYLNGAYKKYKDYRDLDYFSFKKKYGYDNSYFQDTQEYEDGKIVYWKLDGIMDFVRPILVTVGIILGMVTILFLIALLIYAINVPACNSAAISFEHYTTFWNSCMVKYNGIWIPFENLKFIVK